MTDDEITVVDDEMREFFRQVKLEDFENPCLTSMFALTNLRVVKTYETRSIDYPEVGSEDKQSCPLLRRKILGDAVCLTHNFLALGTEFCTNKLDLGIYADEHANWRWENKRNRVDLLKGFSFDDPKEIKTYKEHRRRHDIVVQKCPPTPYDPEVHFGERPETPTAWVTLHPKDDDFDDFGDLDAQLPDSVLDSLCNDIQLDQAHNITLDVEWVLGTEIHRFPRSLMPLYKLSSDGVYIPMFGHIGRVAWLSHEFKSDDD